MRVTIERADSKAAVKEFIALPPRLYRGLAGYTAPMTMERRGLLDPAKAPFFKHGEAQYWIARKDGAAVGRISAQIDHAQIRASGPGDALEGAGMFGCLDAIDELEVVRALIETAEDWIADRGFGRVFGPCLLSMNEEAGLLVEGREEPALIMVPWHPAYLEGHVEACGYAKMRDLHYWRLDSAQAELEARRVRLALQRRRPDLVVRALDLKNLARDVEIMRAVYNDAWQDNWGFVPLQKEDLEGISKDLKPFVPADAGVIVEMAGRPVGVALVLPNLFEATGDLGADPSPLGWLKLGYRMFTHRFRTGRIILLGVVFDLRHSVGGAAIAMTMIDEMIARSAHYETDWLEAGWVLENNQALLKILEQFNFKRVRTLRLYDKVLEADAAAGEGDDNDG
ncbi:MAG: hypothetical protein KDJ46_03705 [Rhodobiaceae bacterium]|nr:hypothetical protein [Rhodobiaceae bacterium]